MNLADISNGGRIASLNAASNDNDERDSSRYTSKHSRNVVYAVRIHFNRRERISFAAISIQLKPKQLKRSARSWTLSKSRLPKVRQTIASIDLINYVVG